MLSAGQPQPSVTPAVDSVSSIPTSKARMLPDMKSNEASITPLGPTSAQKGPVQHIWVVTGPAGCGKSTVGKAICNELGIPFLEGDDVSRLCAVNAAFQGPRTSK